MNEPLELAELPELTGADAPRDHVRRTTLARIRHFLSEPGLGVYRDLKGMCERVSDSYRDRVVVELLQNAHDAHPVGDANGRIRIALVPNEGEFGTLYFANDGNSFAQGNFDALCSPTQTTKSVNEAIGNKGVGFLSVFQVCSHPEVYSRISPSSPDFDGYCFTFAADATLRRLLAEEGLGDRANQVIANMPRLYLACPVDARRDTVAQLAKEGFATAVRLPLKSADALDAVRRQLAKLTGEVPPVQLFLPRIRELSVSSDPELDTVRLERRPKLVHRFAELRLLRVNCGQQDFIVAEKTLPEAVMLEIIARDVAAEALPETWLDWTGDAVVSIAVAAAGARLAPRLYNFLPMGEDAHAPFAGYLDAPFFARLDRLQIQGGVELNRFLMDAARDLALEAGVAAAGKLPREEARQAVLDLVLWSGETETMRERIRTSGEALVPTIALGRADKGWAALDKAKLWQGDAFLSPQFVAKDAGFPIVDGDIGAERLTALRDFVAGTPLLECSVSARADIVERVAQKLRKPKSGLKRWNQFYHSLGELFRDDAPALAGRRLLLNARGDLERTETAEPARRGRRRRLSAVFLPPLRSASGEGIAAALPKAVQRRLAFMHEGLELATNGTSAARRFLLQSNLVREHESREILRLLAGAIAEPGETRDPDALRWESLTAMMRMVAREDIAEGVISEISPLVPTREGWSRASTAYFARWQGTRGSDLEDLFERAAGISAELDQHARRLLRPYREWRVAPNERDNWTAFLKKAGVADTLRPVQVIAGAMPREWPARLQEILVQRANLPQAQQGAWVELMGSGWNVTNPQTQYTASGVLRLPGQLDYAALAPAIGREYAEQVIRLIDATPSILRFTIHRPLHPQAPNTRSWPSPIAAFVRGTAWIPLTSGGQAGVDRAWLPGETRTPPPLLPIASIEFRQVLARHPAAAEKLREAGLAEFGSRRDMWRLLAVAGTLVTAETSAGDAERMLSAVQDAWLHADLDAGPPAGFKLVGRRAGRIVSTDPRSAGEGSILIVDGDDRQLAAATARAEPATVTVEPPTARARDVASYLAKHFPAAVRRASQIVASYECEGIPVMPSAADPSIDEVLGDHVRQIVALTLRYRSSFYRGNPEETLARLTRVRVRQLSSLSLRVGEICEPVPRFDERAVLLGGQAEPTILYSQMLAATDRLLVGLAPAIGAALGAPRAIGEPLLAFAAELGTHTLDATYEDYAAVLNVPVEDIKGFLGAARGSITDLLRILRPLVALFAGETEAARFAPGAGLLSEDDVLAALEHIGKQLPVPPTELAMRCRESGDLRAIAVALQLDMAELNRVLSAFGPPYVTIDLHERHLDTLAKFLTRKEAWIRESIRSSWWPRFAAGEDLAGYVVARDAARPALPEGYGLRETELTQGRMQEWLDAWMAEHDISPVTELPTQRRQLEPVREANARLLRSLVPELRIAILARTEPDDPIRKRWASVIEAESAVVAAARSGGWTDFDPLDDLQVARWLARAGWWPKAWPGLDELRITDNERDARKQQDERDRIAATTVKRQMAYSGGTFTFGVDALGSLSDHIASLVESNSVLLNTSARTLQGEAPQLSRSHRGGGGGAGGGGNPHISEEERSLIGFFGEAIAFAWLKRRYGAKRVVDETCWQSTYRRHVFGEEGDDSLGYDFEVPNGGTRWLFEVKSTTAAGPARIQSLELGSTEFECAEANKADRRVRYRILYITDALHPENARIFPLPNPRSRQGLAFFADLQVGRRLYFPLKP